jgi:leucyl aminopeptidase (aminopeptidase T)
MPDLRHAVDTILTRSLAVTAGEEVLVIVDPDTLPIGEALRDGARGLGAEVTLAAMDQRASHGAEPPRPIAAAMAGCDVFIAPTTKSLSHTQARARASGAGARGATMPGVTGEMLERVMAGDYERMVERSRTVGALLDAAAQARVRCPRGTDVTLELSGRPGLADDGVLTEPGAFGNLPAGEGFIAPLGGSGTIVASSLAGIGVSEDPAHLTMEDGRLVAAERGGGPELLAELRAHGELGTNLAELGVGTNESAMLTGNVLEDEKILGSVHLAFGASAGIGGTVSVPIHLDVVVMEATLEIDGRPVLEAGRYLL